MSMHLLELVFFSSLSCLAGLVFAWWIQARGHRDHVADVVRDMTEKVRERYLAYLDLERRITGVFARFDEREAELERLRFLHIECGLRDEFHLQWERASWRGA